MPQELNPLPRTASQWIGAFVILLGWVVSVVTLWVRLIDKINGLGGRVDDLEKADSEKGGRMTRYENEVQDVRRAIAAGATQIGELKTEVSSTRNAVDALEDHLTGFELKLEGRLGEIKGLISDGDARFRERLAKIETTIETYHKDD